MKIWDNKTKQWLIPSIIFFRGDGSIWRVDAANFNDELYELEGPDLSYIAISDSIRLNKDLIPCVIPD